MEKLNPLQGLSEDEIGSYQFFCLPRLEIEDHRKGVTSRNWLRVSALIGPQRGALTKVYFPLFLSQRHSESDRSKVQKMF